MPEEAYWESLFDVPLILSRLGIKRFRDVAELGCGYGTFSIPVARAIQGTLFTFDMVRHSRRRRAALQHPALRGANPVTAARGRRT
jgi:tRNA A58 N-methylase Trm61